MESFPQSLHHELPTWVNPDGAVFHVRIRAAPENLEDLTNENLAPKLLASAIEYARRQIWWPTLFLIMPDHIHALLSFNMGRKMSRVIGDWKKWHHVQHAVKWQENFFDHRLRRDESLEEKACTFEEIQWSRACVQRQKSGLGPWITLRCIKLWVERALPRAFLRRVPRTEP
jgi:hypothetical protein